MTIKDFLDLIRLDKKRTFIIVLFLTLLLILKRIAIHFFNAASFYNNFEVFIFIVDILMWCVLIVNVGSDLFVSQFNKFRMHGYLKHLDGKKLQILKELYNDESYKGYFKRIDTNILELEEAKVIYKTKSKVYIQPGSIEDFNNPKVPYVLQSWAIEYCNRHRDKYIKY